MQIINKTTNISLANEVIIAQSFFKKAKGLLGVKEFKEGHALIIKPCNSIHTFFMQISIDVIFVDAANIVVKCIPNLPPFRLSPIYFEASYVIELPAGTINKTQVKTGDCLLIS
ncbi:MAG: DUF192 domain-containing protein [Candidatus Omnitrophica bacterium]|nr:DUF192 domain-containing protein [Candidatus Omnitrophota bacterium]